MTQPESNNQEFLNNLRSSPLFNMINEEMQKFFINYYQNASKEQCDNANEAVNSSNQRMQEIQNNNSQLIKEQQELGDLIKEAKQLSKKVKLNSIGIKVETQKQKDNAEAESIIDKLN